MKSIINQPVQQEICAKHNDNVIYYAECGVVLCR